MTTTEELIEGICSILRTTKVPPPITFMNYEPAQASNIIAKVLLRCALEGISIGEVHIDSNLARFLSVGEGERFLLDLPVIVRRQEDLGRQVLFVKS